MKIGLFMLCYNKKNLVQNFYRKCDLKNNFGNFWVNKELNQNYYCKIKFLQEARKIT